MIKQKTFIIKHYLTHIEEIFVNLLIKKGWINKSDNVKYYDKLYNDMPITYDKTKEKITLVLLFFIEEIPTFYNNIHCLIKNKTQGYKNITNKRK